MSGAPSRLLTAAPILPVSQIESAAALYTRLGFAVERFQGDAAYAFASRDTVQLHLAQVQDLDPATSQVAVFFYVEDAARLHEEWLGAGLPGRLIAPKAREYGLLEGAYVDPDGNLLRFGSASIIMSGLT